MSINNAKYFNLVLLFETNICLDLVNICLKTHAKISKIKNLHLIIQKNLMFKKYNAHVLREYCYICVIICTLRNVNIFLFIFIK
jgi:hypothetical protein